MTTEAMENIPDLYVIGLPIITPIGSLYPLKVKDYPTIIKYLQLLNLEDFEFKNMLKGEKGSFNDELYTSVKDTHFFNIIRWVKDEEIDVDVPLYPLYQISSEFYNDYRELFKLCFKGDVIDLIKTSEDFEGYRDIIREFNGIEHDRPNPNPEIERFARLKRMLDAKSGDVITFNSMYTSVLVATGCNPNDLTLYQFYKVFSRIGHFKNFDTTTLFRTVNNDVEVAHWAGQDKVTKESVITEDQLQRAREQGKNGLQEKL